MLLTIRRQDARALCSPLVDGLMELLPDSEPSVDVPLPDDVDLGVCETIVRSLASGCLPPKPKTVAEVVRMRGEDGPWARACMFLGVEFVYPHCPGDVDFMVALEATSPEMHAAVVRDRLLRCTKLAFPGRAEDEPYLDLVQLTSELLGAQRTFEYDETTSTVIRAPCSGTYRTPSVDQLVRMRRWLRERFGAARWFDGAAGIVVAGGFPLASLFGKVGFEGSVLPSDVDVFCCVNPRAARAAGRPVLDVAREVLTGFVDALRASWTIVCVTSPVGSHVANVVVKDPATCNLVKIQLVLAVYETPAHVVHGFDLAPCKILFDGARVMATRSAVSCLQTGVFLFDETTMSTSMCYRITKFIVRFGLGAFVPGLPSDVVVDERSAGCNPIFTVAVLWLPGSETLWQQRVSDYGDAERTVGETHGTRLLPAHLERMVVWTTGSRAFTGAFNPVKDSIFRGLVV